MKIRNNLYIAYQFAIHYMILWSWEKTVLRFFKNFGEIIVLYYVLFSTQPQLLQLYRPSCIFRTRQNSNMKIDLPISHEFINKFKHHDLWPLKSSSAWKFDLFQQFLAKFEYQMIWKLTDVKTIYQGRIWGMGVGVNWPLGAGGGGGWNNGILPILGHFWQ